MTFRFVEKCLQMNSDSPDQIDGIVIMKILIAILENLQGRVDEALPYIIKIAMD